MIPPTSALSGRAALARPLLVVILGAALAVGCIGGGSADAPSLSPSASGPSPSDGATATVQPSPSSTSSDVATQSPSATASPTATAPPEPGQSLSPEEAVLACAGSDDNRGFFLAASRELDWPVYCPVLPERWFVSSGTYSARGVGQLVIGYRGPQGATLTLQQGGFCETADGCVPAGTDAGEASFGDQQGTFVTLDDGGYAIVVGRADTPSWLATASGMDEATFRTTAAEFVRLD